MHLHWCVITRKDCFKTKSVISVRQPSHSTWTHVAFKRAFCAIRLRHSPFHRLRPFRYLRRCPVQFRSSSHKSSPLYAFPDGHVVPLVALTKSSQPLTNSWLIRSIYNVKTIVLFLFISSFHNSTFRNSERHS